MSWASDVEVCNGALSLLGAARLTSLADDNSKEAILCRMFYETARDATLRRYPWNFCTKRLDFGAPVATTDPRAPVYGYTQGFVLPTNPYCLRVLETENHVSHRVEGRVLYCDAASVKARCIIRVTSISEWDPLAANVLAVYLAALLAMPITKDKAMQQSMLSLYGSLLADAQHVDTSEGTPDEIDSDELIDIRGGGGVSRSQYLAR